MALELQPPLRNNIERGLKPLIPGPGRNDDPLMPVPEPSAPPAEAAIGDDRMLAVAHQHEIALWPLPVPIDDLRAVSADLHLPHPIGIVRKHKETQLWANPRLQ